MVDHMNAWLRPKRDQQFSHSLSEKQTLVYFLRYAIPHIQHGLLCVVEFAHQ